MKQIICESFEDFVQKFSSIFENLGNQIVLAPVRSGKSYHSEKFIIETLQKNEKKIVVFITEKNLLAESSYGNILSGLKENKSLKSNNVFLFNPETSRLSYKNLKLLLKEKTSENIAILSSFCYFAGDQHSPLFKILVKARKEQSYKIVFIVDEAESLFNSFESEIILEKPQDKLFKTSIKGNALTSIDSSKSELLINHDVKFSDEYSLIRGRITAIPADKENFDCFNFSTYNINTHDLILCIYVKNKAFSDFTAFCNIEEIFIWHEIFVTKENEGGILKICRIEENIATFNSDIFSILETLYEKQYFSCYYTLIALINNILRSSSVYIRYRVITSKENQNKPLGYSEACEKYSTFKAAKSQIGSSNIKATDYFNYSKIGKLYQFELVFNKNSAISSIEDNSDQVIYLSGTWNLSLINSTYYQKPFFLKIRDKDLATDLLKLTSLASFPFFDDENKVAYPRRNSARTS
jgi:hypothetical protein